MSARRPVAFVVGARTLSRWGAALPRTAGDVDERQQQMRSGEDVWMVQGHALLREALSALGHDVSIGATFPAGAICIAHWDALNRYSSGAFRGRVIGVRADRPPLRGCDCVVVQNNLMPDTPGRRHIPLWPQPGLLPRDPARGARLERVAHFGRTERLPGWMTSDAFGAALARLGIRLDLSERQWNDYRDVDAVLSLRTESALMLEHKPASKLTNAWLAGVPALLGDEPAFRALRRSELDYVAIGGADDALAAIAALRAHPERYRAMLEAGSARAAEFTREAIARRWLTLIAEIDARPGATGSWWRYAVALTRQKVESKSFRRRHAREQAQLGNR